MEPREVLKELIPNNAWEVITTKPGLERKGQPITLLKPAKLLLKKKLNLKPLSFFKRGIYKQC